MAVGALARKEFRLLARDRLSAGILLGMPLLFILMLGLLLGEGFGQKTDNRLRVSLVDRDQGYKLREGMSWFALTPAGPGLPMQATSVLALQETVRGFEPWSEVVRRDLAETAEIRVEIIDDPEEADQLVRSGRRAAVLEFGPMFSERVHACSFLAGKDREEESRLINPFYRDGVNLRVLNARLMKDPSQVTASSIIDQVGQVTLLRVVLPWMIGRAFDRMSDPEFVELLSTKVNVPTPNFNPLAREKTVNRQLKELLDLAAGLEAGLSGRDPKEVGDTYRKKVGLGVKKALAEQFKKYNLTTERPGERLSWEKLTKAQTEKDQRAETVRYQDEAGRGWLNRGAARYQILVPSYTVMFAFALVLPVGWLFVMERRQGTLKRLKAAPVTRGQVVLGKFLPCFVVSLVQGVFLLVAGKLVFGMSWGPTDWPLWKQVLTLGSVAGATSLAAMGLALLLAALARTEIQVALVGSLLVLLLGLLSGCLIPRELMPEAMIEFSRVTPHAWALDAYRQLLVRPEAGTDFVPNLGMVARSCAVLCTFGGASIALAWSLLRLD